MERKKIKIKFIDFWQKFNPERFLILRLLRKHFDVTISDDADYVIFSTFGETHWRVPDSAVKIFYTQENLVPDFNACDYAIGFEWMDYEDRYVRFPNYLVYGNSRTIVESMCHKHELPEGWDLKSEKPSFCSFVVSNNNCRKRNEVFEALCAYKMVDSGGKFLNNIGGPVKDKIEFESKHKFSICFENSSHNGYTTEKLPQALAARTVPIYWGDPKVSTVFNHRAFINASDFVTVGELVEEIKRIDNDDQLYMSMLKEPALVPSAPSFEEETERMENWLIPIFERPIQESYRRSREMHGKWYTSRRFILSAIDPGNPNRYKELLSLIVSKAKSKLQVLTSSERSEFRGFGGNAPLL
ncbi:MAG: glycosyltransferase [Bacteroidales bacterium]|nr:glycosyltransferase [Bacteroidales bacterium]